MHLGNGALTPECAALTTAAAAIGLGAAAYFARRELAAPEKLLAAGAYGAFIFAAQMVNVPVLPYSSGHLVGGILLAAALGPGLGALTMAAILALQAMFLGDGGLAALGANVLNMALLPAALVALVRQCMPADLPSTRQALWMGPLAMLATLLAAGMIVGEVALFRRDLAALPLVAFTREMLLAHLVIGLGEGLVSAAIILALQGELLPTDRRALVYRAKLAAFATLALLLVGLPLAGNLDDGYETSAQRSGWTELLK